MLEKFSLSWDNFQNSTLTSIKELLRNEEFTDVTLVCDDEKQLKTHKVILSASSPFFRKILLQNPHPHPLIYISNISWTNLSNLIMFMYLGKVEVEQQDLGTFLADANKLGIKGLAEMYSNTTNLIPMEAVDSLNNMDGNVKNLVDELNQEDDQVNFKLDENTIANQHGALEEVSLVDVWDGNVEQEYTIDIDTKVESQFLGQYQAQFFCAKCDYKSNKQFNVKKHTLSIHEGVRYPCDQCDYRATENGHLKKHKRNKHSQMLSV